MKPKDKHQRQFKVAAAASPLTNNQRERYLAIRRKVMKSQGRVTFFHAWHALEMARAGYHA